MLGLRSLNAELRIVALTKNVQIQRCPNFQTLKLLNFLTIPGRARIFCMVPVFFKSWTIALSVATAAAMLLAGCVHFKPQPVSTAQVARDFDGRSLDQRELKEFLERNLKTDPMTW